MIKITKFGGSSVADAEHFRKIKAIIDADPARRFVVVSACGRRHKADTKVTDLLYLVDAHVNYHVSCEDLLADIGQRYFDIADELGLSYPIREEFAAFAERARSGGYTTEELVSRGEYFTARLMAEYLDLPFIDAADMVAFHHDGTLSMSRTAKLVKQNAREGGFVMPGFYGATKEGKVKLLDRGGGDISGSILAQCLEADLYENWTDVSGFLSADPRIVPGAQPIPRITYEELRELSYMGASVLHEEAVFPVRDAGIPLVIKNTNAPEDPGTIISETAKEGDTEPIITGIAGKRNFLAINVSRDRTKSRIGFMRRYLHRVAGGKLMKLFGGRLRFLGIGGAKLDGGAEKFLLEARVPYAIGYGLTETAPLLAGAAPSMVRLGSTGPQAPGVELRLENVNPETRQGEIVARTPSAMVGYFKNPEATKEAFTADGWFRTGDLGELDKDGWLYIKGRLKNMIVGPGGENIYPEDIETVLNSHVCIADSIVTEQEGRLIALVHFNREEIESMIDDWREEWESKKEAWEAKTEQLKKEIMDFVNAKVNRFSRISEVVEEKEDFIKTPTQKIKRFLYNKSKKEGKTPDQPAAGK